VRLLAAALSVLALAGPALGTGGELERILRAHADRLGPVLERSEELRLQLVLATVVEREDKPPVLERSSWRADAEYFYPASAIKLCAAVGVLESLGEVLAGPSDPPLDLTTLEGPYTVWLLLTPGDREATPASMLEAVMDAPMSFDGCPPDPARHSDPSNLDGGAITLRHEIRKLALVSDNRAFNRLYDILGQDELNERMWAAGMRSARLRHRLSVRLTPEENRRVSQVRMLLRDDLGELARPERTSDLELDVPDVSGLDVGKAWREDDGTLVEGPVSFRDKNRMSLVDLQDLLVKVVRPDVDLGTPGFALTEAQRALLVEAMTQLPRESANPRYDPQRYPDDFVKFLLPGLRRVVPAERLRVTNKVGLAYGFTVENAWVEDIATGRGFFLAGTLYTNANGVLNDGVYEYDTVALPFWADLGEALARELLLAPSGGGR
jgi:hypothetical protein